MLISIFSNITFKHPLFFLLLLLVPLFIYLKYRTNKQFPTLTLSDVEGISKTTGKAKFLFLLPLLRILGFILLVVALARPQNALKNENVTADVRDLMLVMDMSGSMNDNFYGNRSRSDEERKVTVSKKVAAEFVRGREYDRMGLIIFGKDAYTVCPLTTDHHLLSRFIEDLRIDREFGQKTNIGLGLGTAINRIKDTEAKTKAIIFLTDGVDSGTDIPPLEAVKLAKKVGIKVYTVGIGQQENQTGMDFWGRRVEQKVLDVTLLKQMAKETNGKFFLAKTEDMLRNIFKTIDQLETTKVEVSQFQRYSEEYRIFALIAFLCLLLEFILSKTILRVLPA